MTCNDFAGAALPPKLLFTPGPLTTSATVKRAMLRDLGSRDAEFIRIVAEIRARLLHLACVSRAAGYEAVLLQGSGTFGIEAVLTSLPVDGRWLVIINGAYGERMAKILAIHRIAHVPLRVPEHRAPDPAQVDQMLAEDPAITAVAVVHCETTTGILNPVEPIGAVVASHQRTYFVDAMSSFGAVPLDLATAQIDFLVSSANKCIEGVPGFSFVICRRSALERCAGGSRTLSLDLYEQWRGLERDGQFRFTPPTHALLAFYQALVELEQEGGVAGRGRRYERNRQTLLAGMQALGFDPYLAPEHRSSIITSFRYPRHPAFRFAEFYDRLSARGCLIYPGKVSDADCFRIGTIGRIDADDIQTLIEAIRAVCAEMGMTPAGGSL